MIGFVGGAIGTSLALVSSSRTTQIGTKFKSPFNVHADGNAHSPSSRHHGRRDVAIFQPDAAHTSYASDLGGPGIEPDVNWRSEIWVLVTRPVVSDGAIFFAPELRQTHLHAIDAATGETIWDATRTRSLPELVEVSRPVFGCTRLLAIPPGDHSR